MLHDLHGEDEAEEQLVPFKQAAAYIDVQAVGEVLVQQLATLRNAGSLQASGKADTHAEGRQPLAAGLQSNISNACRLLRQNKQATHEAAADSLLHEELSWGAMLMLNVV
jgi:hypothetical protein